jgi:hypothetical protein
MEENNVPVEPRKPNIFARSKGAIVTRKDIENRNTVGQGMAIAFWHGPRSRLIQHSNL